MFKKIAVSMLLIASAFNAQAAGSAPFGVTGTITPAACDVTLTGGVVSLGVLSTVTVRGYTNDGRGMYQVPAVPVPISIVCSASTHVAILFADNHAGKAFPMDGYDLQRFGIVDGNGTASIGAFRMFFNNTTIDGAAVNQFLNTPAGTPAWSPNGFVDSAATANPGRITGFSKTAGATTPDALTTLSGTLNFLIWVSKAYVDSATNSITPAGSGTISLVYL